MTKKDIQGVCLFTQSVEKLPPSQTRSLLDEMKAKNGSGIYVIAGIDEDKVSLLIGITPDLCNKFDAVTLIKGCVEAIGGKGGGGRKEFAQAGGNMASGIQNAFDLIENMVKG